eukprot:1051752-Alexandrium_andersonii.AAC.1
MAAEKTLRKELQHGNVEYIENAVQDTLNWLGGQRAEKEELEARLEDLEGLVRDKLDWLDNQLTE